jgi:deoxyribonuclease I
LGEFTGLEDFSFYHPESEEEYIHNQCDVAVDARFEPEHGKGKDARAMTYFLLRIQGLLRKPIELRLIFTC